MPLKQPKKPRIKKKSSISELDEIIQDFNEASEDTLIDSAVKLTKALKIPSSTPDSERLIRMLKKSMEVSDIPAYIKFLQDEWVELKIFTPNHGTRQSNLIMSYTLSRLCTYHSLLVSMFKTYKTSKAEYQGRLGALDSWEVEKVKIKDEPHVEIKRLKAEIEAQKHRLSKRDKEFEDIRSALNTYTKAYARARRFAMFFQAHVFTRVSEDQVLTYIENGEIPDVKMPEWLQYLFE